MQLSDQQCSILKLNSNLHITFQVSHFKFQVSLNSSTFNYWNFKCARFTLTLNVQKRVFPYADFPIRILRSSSIYLFSSSLHIVTGIAKNFSFSCYPQAEIIDLENTAVSLKQQHATMKQMNRKRRLFESLNRTISSLHSVLIMLIISLFQKSMIK